MIYFYLIYDFYDVSFGMVSSWEVRFLLLLFVVKPVYEKLSDLSL